MKPTLQESIDEIAMNYGVQRRDGSVYSEALKDKLTALNKPPTSTK